jgi:hypothetical protein
VSYSPFLDLSKQIIAGALPRGDPEEELAAREVLIKAAAGTPFWGTDPGAWETVRFAKNILLPGNCRLKGKGFAQKLQRDSAAGTHGHKVKQLGIQPAKFTITVRMWTEDHLRAFERLVPLLKSQRYKVETTSTAVGYTGTVAGATNAGFTSASAATGNEQGTFVAGFSGVVPGTTQTTKKSTPAGPAALDVYHPVLALFKIRSVHITEVGFPEAGDDDVWTSEIDCEEFVYRPSAVKAAASSLDIVESNPLIGKTGGTLAQEEKKNAKPSKFTKGPPVRSGGASGGW